MLRSVFAGIKVEEGLSRRKSISSGSNTAAFNDTKIEEHLRPTDEEESYCYFFINHIMPHSGLFCTSFFGYEQGKIGHVIKESFDKDQINITAFPAPKADDGKEQQYLDGKLYFVCSDNHVILSQDAHLKAKRLEHYLNEMFHKRCDSFPENQQLILERSLSRKVRRQIKVVKKIHLSAPLKYKYQEHTASGLSAGEKDLKLLNKEGLFYRGEQMDYYLLYRLDVEYLREVGARC